MRSENLKTLDALEQEIPHLRRFARYISRDADRADDLVQECLARAVANIDSWQPGTNLRAWLFVILRNVYRNELRKKALRTVPLQDDGNLGLSVEGGQETRVALLEANDAFLQLSDDHREILLLICVEGMSYEEVSGILELPLGTVRSRLARARISLREKMRAKEEEAGDQSKERSGG